MPVETGPGAAPIQSSCVCGGSDQEACQREAVSQGEGLGHLEGLFNGEDDEDLPPLPDSWMMPVTNDSESS